MKSQPLLVSIIISIMAVFVIVGASLVAKLSSVNKLYHNESLKNIELSKINNTLNNKISSLEKRNNDLESKNSALKKEVNGFKDQIANDVIKIEKLKKYKEVLEDKLKEELMKSNNSDVTAGDKSIQPVKE